MKHPIPLDVTTQHLGIVGRTGAGKTFTAKGLVEQLLDAGRRVVVLDPTGAWWGLQSLADGTPGYALPVIGGEHGNVPLHVEQAEQLAEWLTTKPRSAVLDLSELLIGERHRFVEVFADALYRRNRTPLHLVIDEADEFCPQNPLPETRRMLHHVDRIVRRGRIRGFRVTMITQRPAAIHKNVLTQVNALVAMRLTAPQDRKAIEAWVEGQADAKKGREVLDTLARLQRGEGWVWAPELDVLERVRFPAIRTFDSSRSPEDGAPAETPRGAALDVQEILELRALTTTAAEMNAGDRTDYADLEQQLMRANRRIADLEGELSRNAGCTPADVGHARRAGYLEGRLLVLTAVRAHVEALAENVRKLAEDVEAEPVEWTSPAAARPPAPQPADAVVEKRWTSARAEKAAPSTAHGAPLGKAERLVLTALAQYPQGRTRTQAAILTGYSSEGGGFRNTLSALRTRGWMEGDEVLRITPAGRKALGPYEALPTGRALLDHWLRQLSKAERAILEALHGAYPRALSRQAVAQRAGYEADGGGFRNALSRLRTLELISGRDELKASDTLFDRIGR